MNRPSVGCTNVDKIIAADIGTNNGFALTTLTTCFQSKSRSKKKKNQNIDCAHKTKTNGDKSSTTGNSYIQHIRHSITHILQASYTSGTFPLCKIEGTMIQARLEVVSLKWVPFIQSYTKQICYLTRVVLLKFW